MENITLGQIAAFLAWIIAFGGSVGAIWKIIDHLKRYLTKIIVTEIEPLKQSIKETNAKIDKTDLEACKNYLVRFLADVEQGHCIDEIEMQRFWEQYEHYEKMGGNSYIHQKVEKLKAKELL